MAFVKNAYAICSPLKETAVHKRKKFFPPILLMYAGAVVSMGVMVVYRISTEAPGVMASFTQ